jgi:hypothetical protein
MPRYRATEFVGASYYLIGLFSEHISAATVWSHSFTYGNSRQAS